MTAEAREIARAMEACYPRERGDDSVLYQNAEAVAAMQHQWGICLGALAEGLVRSGALAEAQKIAFFREAGLAIYD